MNTKELQQALGTTPDGIIGPKTLAALAAAHYDIVLDPGHTADHAREHPSAWPVGYWEREPGKTIAAALGITARTADSVEHTLNLAVAKATAARLETAGLKTLLYDNPQLGNNAEIAQVRTIVNAAKPRAFISLHANASKGVSTTASNTATGTLTYYAAGRPASKQLATHLTDHLLQYRRSAQGPNNRADKTAIGSYAILTKTNPAIPAALVEIGFYDSDLDLSWMSRHISGIGAALTNAIINSLKR